MKIMGILNTTPDSFFSPSRVSLENGVSQALKMVAEGADVLDIGGESTRPGSAYVEAEEEIRRVLPLVQALNQQNCGAEISIDTRKRKTAEACVRAGARWINDISALEDDPSLASFIADSGVKIVLMHRQGHPQSMQADPRYTHVVSEVCGYLTDRANWALSQGIKPGQILLDPGFGFGKTVENNIHLMQNLPDLCQLGFPVLVGVSRKSFLGSFTSCPPEQRLPASLTAALAAWEAGVSVIRVHDVEPTRQALLAWKAFKKESSV